MCIFQSTLPREERRKKQSYNVRNRQFQSTLPREERRDNMKVIAEIEKFQSTLPREERLSSQARLIWWHQHFNPRSHERSDKSVSSGIVRLCIFQSTLPREERQFLSQPPPNWLNFNPRSHERSDSGAATLSLSVSDFNPRSHERSDNSGNLIRGGMVISIHAPTRGATAILHKKFVYFYTIPTINI